MLNLQPTRQQVDTSLKSLRNRLRRYSASSIASLAYDSLHAPFSTKLNALRSAPWLAILIAKWALQDLRIPLESGTPMPLSDFERTLQEFWDLQGDASIALGTTAAELFRNAINAQFDFQKQQPYYFLRWPALVDALPTGHEMKSLFANAMQMEPLAYSDHALAVFALFNKHELVPLNAFAALTGVHGDAGKKFFELTAQDYSSLRTALQADDAYRVNGIYELFQSPFLKRYPLRVISETTIGCWHPMVLARGMEDIVHLRLSALEKRYPLVFSKVFEQHVVDQLNDSKIPYVSEQKLKESFGDGASTVEAVIECRDCNVFVEAKMSLFWDQVLVSDSPSDAFEKSWHVRKAIFQGLRVGELLRSPTSPYAGCAKKSRDFLLVVTSRELNLAGGKFLERLFPPDALADIYPEGRGERRSLLASKHLSPERVFILSVEDYERLIGTVGRGRIDLQDLLDHAAAQNLSPETAHFMFSDYLVKYAADGWPIPHVTEKYWDTTWRRLEALLPT